MRNPRTIIIDDYVRFTNTFKTWFSQMGYEALTFPDPTACPIYRRETKNCIKKDPCADIIITDLKLPRMNSIEFLQYQSQRGCKIDIRNKAIISGYIDDEKRKAIENLGCSFFKKPLELPLISYWLNKCEKRMDLSKPLESL